MNAPQPAQPDPIAAELLRYARRRVLVQALIGLCVALAVGLLGWLLLAWAEGEWWLAPALRTGLLSALILTVLSLLGGLVARPWLRHLRQRPEQRALEAGRQLGGLIPTLADRLVNYLQLRAEIGSSGSLRAADLAQRTHELAPLRFERQVPWRQLRRPAAMVAGVLLLLALLSWISPTTFGGGQQRLLAPTRAFAPPPPFEVEVLHITQPVIEGRPFELRVRTRGKTLPERLDFILDGAVVGFPMRPEADGSFGYTLPNPTEGFDFQLGTPTYRTPATHIDVWGQPVLSELRLELRYPAYTGLKSEVLPAFVGDATVPRGTRLIWRSTWNGPVSDVSLEADGKRLAFAYAEPTATGALSAMAPFTYRLRGRSPQGVEAADTQRYRIEVLADRAPTVLLSAPAVESLLPPSGITELAASAGDDYGLTEAWLLTRQLSQGDSAFVRRPLPAISGREASIESRIDWIELGMRTGETWEVAVEVADNDAVWGRKWARSAVHLVRYSDREEVLQASENQQDSIASNLASATDRAARIQAELDRLKRDALEGKSLDFDTQRRLEELQREQEKVQRELDQSRAQLERLRDEAQRQASSSPQQIEQLKRLEDLLKQLGSRDEIQKFLESLRKQENEMSSRNLFRQLEQLDRTGRYQQTDLNRMKQLFEAWRRRQERENLAQRLDDLKQRQQNLEGQTREQRGKEHAQQLTERQQQLANEMNQRTRDLESLEQRTPNTPRDSSGRGELEKAADQITQRMNEARQRLQQNQRRGAQQQQQQAIDQLDQLQDQLQNEETDGELEQATENYENLRALTENLLKLSFDQEASKDALKSVRGNDPSLKQKSANQVRIQEELKHLQDSLEALAARVPQIKQDLLDQSRRIEENIDYALGALDERQIGQAGVYQQEAMAGMNALANLFVDALNQLQMQLRSAQQRKGKPQPGGQSMRDLAQQQEQLGNEMNRQAGEQRDMDALKRMADQQAQIREKLEELYQNLQKEGEKGLGSLGKVAEDMKANEQDLRAEQITRETLERQQQILSRMLDYDKSLREREFDEQRSSRSGTDQPRRVGGQSPDAQPGQAGRDVLQRRKLTFSPSLQQVIDRYFEALKPTGKLQP